MKAVVGLEEAVVNKGRTYDSEKGSLREGERSSRKKGGWNADE